MGCLILLFLMVVMLIVAMWMTVQILGLLLTLFVAGLGGAPAGGIVPGHLPGGEGVAGVAGGGGGAAGGGREGSPAPPPRTARQGPAPRPAPQAPAPWTPPPG